MSILKLFDGVFFKLISDNMLNSINDFGFIYVLQWYLKVLRPFEVLLLCQKLLISLKKLVNSYQHDQFWIPSFQGWRQGSLRLLYSLLSLTQDSQSERLRAGKNKVFDPRLQSANQNWMYSCDENIDESLHSSKCHRYLVARIIPEKCQNKGRCGKFCHSGTFEIS